MSTYPRADVDAIHGSTKHGTPPSHPERLIRFQRLNPENAPTRFKQYRGLTVEPLPRDLVASRLPASRVLSGDRGDPPRRLEASLLATLLFLGAGVSRTTGSGPSKTYFRTAMSAGNLHPVEVYVVAGPDVEGLGAGVYHFAPLEFGLRTLRTGDFRSFLQVGSPVALVLTGLCWRTTWKYGERGWRHLYWDAGTMLANLLAAAAAHGVETRVLMGFPDEAVSDVIGVDRADEVPLAVVTLGEGTPAAPAPELVPLSLDVEPVARQPVRLPLLLAAQHEGELLSTEVEGWRRAATHLGTASPRTADPPRDTPEQLIESVILLRGSTRLMRREAVPAPAMEWPLSAANLAQPLDVAGRGTLLEHYVSLHAVDGIRPGAYRWDQGDLSLLHLSERARETAATLCLEQPLGGDSAYTVFHHASLDPLLAALGARGYRAAQLEAGIVSGRLALAAFALGLGATGLTFYDDPVSGYFRTATAPMLVTSVGVPVSGPAPAGRPGSPVSLRRHGRMMDRLSRQLRSLGRM